MAVIYFFLGTEFLQTTTVYSCSLCKSCLLSDKNEVRRHLKSDSHLKSVEVCLLLFYLFFFCLVPFICEYLILYRVVNM